MLKKYKKLFIVFGVIAGALALLQLNHLFVRYKIESGAWVNYNGKWYTSEEDLRKDFPPQYIDAPAKNTPEEVYTEFRQALLNNQIDNALTFVRKENRERQHNAFLGFGDLKELGNIYPDIITKKKIEGNIAEYSYSFTKNGEKINSTLFFGKDSDGYWKLDI